MKVKATAKGFFRSLREEGDEFEVPGGTKASWFAPVVDAPEAEPKPKGRGKAKADANDDAPADDVI